MAKFGLPNLGRLDRKGASRLIRATDIALQDSDYDSGWQATASPIKHRLGRTPANVSIQVSSDKRGSTYDQIEPDSVTSTEITFTTAAAYARVRANL